ncbi:hypothetical protein DES32_1526 [Methylovirgula ligni]|uniref:Uncharacterized protein n=1 Tax=Methylovirgula ligni TaxID=569860 RepID=A0A3D9Z3I0_9HYPH|nr:hypothetical protein [Methylovirgula ligni]REF87889.1 hypothetical protein DES32_1526 [Methylovirgula ligni]
MLARVFLALWLSALCGCASQQLNYNTWDIAANVDDLYTKQVLNNVAKFIDNEWAFPSSVSVSLGTVSTTDTITPSLSFPFTSSIANAAAAASGSVTKTTTLAGTGATLGATNTQTQNWNVTPLSDADTLRNYQAIYRYGIYGTDLIREYKTPDVFLNPSFVPDPYLFQLPHCVLCAAVQGKFLGREKAYHLYVNPDLPRRFIYWRGDPGALTPNRLPLEGTIPLADLGHFGHYELFITAEDYRRGALNNFVFFLMPNSIPAEVFTSAGLPAPEGQRQTEGVHAHPAASFAPSGGASNFRFTPSTQQPNYPLVIPSQ